MAAAGTVKSERFPSHADVATARKVARKAAAAVAAACPTARLVKRYGRLDWKQRTVGFRPGFEDAAIKALVKDAIRGQFRRFMRLPVGWPAVQPLAASYCATSRGVAVRFASEYDVFLSLPVMRLDVLCAALPGRKR